MNSISISCLLVVTAFSQNGSDEGHDELRALYQKARGLTIGGEFASSNDVYATLLDRLPAASGKVDRDRARIHYEMAINHTMTGKSKAALRSLEKAAESGFWDHEYLARDPSLEALRRHKGFPEAIEKVKRALGGMAFGMETVEGAKVDAADYRGKVLIVDVWGTWCPPCRREIPHFVKLEQRYGAQGLRIIGMTYEKRPISDSLRQHVRAFEARNGINYPLVLMPPEMRRDIPGLKGFPTTFFIDHTGLVRERLHGYHDYASLERTALRLLKAIPKQTGEPSNP